MNAQHGSARTGEGPGRAQRTSGWADRQGKFNPSRRRLPPYGKQLVAALADPSSWPGRPGTSGDGLHLTLTVLAGAEAWDAAREWSFTRALFVVAPPDEPPDALDWSLLKDHPPILVRPCPALSQPVTAALVSALVRDGCERALVVGPTGLRLYRGGRANG
jgi:hypothetical protein